MAKKVKKQLSKKKESSPIEKSNMVAFFWLVGVIVLIVLIIVFVPILKHDLFEKFSYAGVNWEKIEVGQLSFYHGVFPINISGNITAEYNLYLRTDPRVNKIPINATFSFSPNVVISLNNTQSCTNMMVGQVGLAQFITAFPFVKNLTSGLANPVNAQLDNSSYITCENASADRTVIIVQNSNNASIIKEDRNNCFSINMENCNYTPAVERYIVGIIAQVNNKTI